MSATTDLNQELIDQLKIFLKGLEIPATAPSVSIQNDDPLVIYCQQLKQSLESKDINDTFNIDEIFTITGVKETRNVYDFLFKPVLNEINHIITPSQVNNSKKIQFSDPILEMYIPSELIKELLNDLIK